MYYNGKHPEMAAEEVYEKELSPIFNNVAHSSSPSIDNRTDRLSSQDVETFQVESWSTAEVVNWLEDTGLESLTPAFDRFKIQGRGLLELKHMRNVDPSGFVAFVKSEENFSLQLNSALTLGYELSKLN